jgi:hypothetical protein
MKVMRTMSGQPPDGTDCLLLYWYRDWDES